MDDITVRAGGRVQAIERGFSLLEVMAARGGPVGVSEFARSTGLSLPTAHRLLRTLVDLGYVRQEPDRNYTLGPKLIRLGEQAAKDLAGWSRPLLESLVERLNESVNLAALDGDSVVYLVHVPSSRSMRMFTEVGSRAPAHCTGVGKAMLAEHDRAGLLGFTERARLVQRTPQTITDVDALDAELRQIRRHGYALDNEEQELGVRCVAVAIPGSNPRLAVSTSGPSSRMDARTVQAAVPLLQEAAQALAEELHGRPGAAVAL